MLDDVTFGVGAVMPTDREIFVLTTTTGVGVVVIITVVVPDIAVDMLSHVNVHGLTAVMTGLEFTRPAPPEDSIRFCSTAFAGLPMGILDCDDVLHTRMPSYHV